MEGMRGIISELTIQHRKTDAGASIATNKENMQPGDFQAREAELLLYIAELKGDRDELLASKTQLQQTCHKLMAQVETMAHTSNSFEGESPLQRRQMQDALARIYKKLLHEKTASENV